MKYVLIVGILAICFMNCMYIVSTTESNTYNPNDEIYMYIPPANDTWTEKFGDNERTRLISSLSELRIVTHNQGLILQSMLDPNDPNYVY